VKEVAVPV
jgi:hypothetical protein